MLRRISGVLKLQRIILKSKSAVSEQEILLTIEKNKKWAECADKKHVNNVTFGATVCFNGCQTSNVWPAKHVLSGTLFSGRSRGRVQPPPPPSPSALFLDQTEARKAEKEFFETPPYLRVWMTSSPPPPTTLTESLDLPQPTVACVWSGPVHFLYDLCMLISWNLAWSASLLLEFFGSLFVQWLILFVPVDTFPSIVTSLWWYCIFAPFSWVAIIRERLKCLRVWTVSVLFLDPWTVGAIVMIKSYQFILSSRENWLNWVKNSDSILSCCISILDTR